MVGPSPEGSFTYRLLLHRILETSEEAMRDEVIQDEVVRDSETQNEDIRDRKSVV